MAPKENLVQVQLHYASSEFTRFFTIVGEYKWLIAAAIAALLLLLYWLWRR